MILHNHKFKIKDRQPGTLKSIFPGMVVTFNYSGENITDKYPMILFLYYDVQHGLVEGLNLNYLSNYKFKMLFEGLKKRTLVMDQPKETSGLISEDYTFINLPPIAKLSRPKSRSESRVEMKRIYEKFMGEYFSESYRSYIPKKIKTLKIINLKDY